jgi:hypothetical protein
MPPAAPSPGSPGAASEPGLVVSTLTPTLQWAAVPGATSYAVGISKYPYGTANLVWNPQVVTGTSVQVPGGILQPGMKYRWNLQVRNSAGQLSPLSSTLYFQTFVPVAAPTAQATPVPPAPAPVAVPPVPAPTSSSAVPPAPAGQLAVEKLVREAAQLESQEKFQAAIDKLEEIRKYDKKSWPADLDLHISQLRAKLQAMAFFGTNTATASTAQLPAVPAVVSPGAASEPGPVIGTLTPTLRWTAVPGAVSYAVGISKYPYGTANLVWNPQSVTGTSVQVPGGILQPGMKYRWNMQARNSAGQLSPLSATFYFQTPAPGAPAPAPAPQPAPVAPAKPAATAAAPVAAQPALPLAAAPVSTTVQQPTLRPSPTSTPTVAPKPVPTAPSPQQPAAAPVLTPSTSLPASQVTLTLYIHAGSATGPVLPGVRVTGKDGAGKAFNLTTDTSGCAMLTGAPGQWQFMLSMAGYQNLSGTSTIVASSTGHLFLTSVPQSSVGVATSPAAASTSTPATSAKPGTTSSPTPTLGEARSRAVAYAEEYCKKVVSDGHYCLSETSYPDLGAGTALSTVETAEKPGADCAHFVSCCIGSEPHRRGGGLSVQGDFPGKGIYGILGAARLRDWFLNEKSGVGSKRDKVEDLQPGDVIYYEGKYQHVALYLGKQEAACHSLGFKGEWHLGRSDWDPKKYVYVHIRYPDEGSTSAAVQPKADPNAILDTIKRRLQALPAYPPYLHGTNAGLRGAIADAAVQIANRQRLDEYDRWYQAALNYRGLAEVQLIRAERLARAGKVEDAQRFVQDSDRCVKLYYLANDAATSVYEAGVEKTAYYAKAIYETSRAAFVLTSSAAGLGPAASVLAEHLYTATDFVVNTSEMGLSKAAKQAVIDVIAQEVGKEMVKEIVGTGLKGVQGAKPTVDLKNLLTRLARDNSFCTRVVKSVAQGTSQEISTNLVSKLMSDVAAQASGNP